MRLRTRNCRSGVILMGPRPRRVYTSHFYKDDSEIWITPAVADLLVLISSASAGRLLDSYLETTKRRRSAAGQNARYPMLDGIIVG